MTVKLVNPKRPITAYLAKGYFNLIKIGNKTKQIETLKQAGIEDTDENIIKVKKEIDDLTKEFAIIKGQICSFTADLRYINVLELRFINGLSQKEIAFKMGCCQDMVNTYIGRALKEFEAYLKENSIEI